VIVHGTYFNATIAVYVTLNLRLGKDEVGSSNLPSSSTETCCPARDSGFLLFSVGKFAYAKPIQKPIPIKFDG